MFVRHERTDRHLHRPPHPARGVPPAARRGPRELPARVGRAGPARAALVRRLRLADRGCRRGRGLRAPGRRLPRLRPRRAARADRAAARRGPRPARRAASSSPRRSSASTTGSAWPRCSCGDPGAVGELLDGPQPSPDPPRGRAPARPGGCPSRHDYERTVVQAKEHIRAGDAFQIVLSQRAERPTSASALELYRSLRRVNPSPYLFLLELDGLALVGSSPETLVKVEGRARR